MNTKQYSTTEAVALVAVALISIIFAPVAVMYGHDPLVALIPFTLAAVCTYLFLRAGYSRAVSVVWVIVSYLPSMVLITTASLLF